MAENEALDPFHRSLHETWPTRQHQALGRAADVHDPNITPSKQTLDEMSTLNDAGGLSDKQEGLCGEAGVGTGRYDEDKRSR